MEPNSANENAPKIESMAPTIHAAKTMETLRPSRAISAGLRKMPVPIMVPTTMAPEAHAPRPRTSSRRFVAGAAGVAVSEAGMARGEYTAKRLDVAGKRRGGKDNAETERTRS